VLKVISRSTFNLQAVLNTLITSAVQLCRAERSTIRLLRGDLYYNVANHGFSLEHQKRMEGDPVKPGQESFVGRPIGLPSRAFRTALGVPLLRQEWVSGTQTVLVDFTGEEEAKIVPFIINAMPHTVDLHFQVTGTVKISYV
jgi:hypothetical protein